MSKGADGPAQQEPRRPIDPRNLVIAIVAGLVGCLAGLSAALTTWLSVRSLASVSWTVLASGLAGLATTAASCLLSALAMKQLLK
jgi:hypothetical protein